VVVRLEAVAVQPLADLDAEPDRPADRHADKIARLGLSHDDRAGEGRVKTPL
jgi:hypothetical protein